MKKINFLKFLVHRVPLSYTGGNALTASEKYFEVLVFILVCSCMHSTQTEMLLFTMNLVWPTKLVGKRTNLESVSSAQYVRAAKCES